MVIGGEIKAGDDVKFYDDDDHGNHDVDDDHPDDHCDDDKNFGKKCTERRRSKTQMKQHLVVMVLVLVDDPNVGKGVQRRGHRG